MCLLIRCWSRLRHYIGLFGKIKQIVEWVERWNRPTVCPVKRRAKLQQTYWKTHRKTNMIQKKSTNDIKLMKKTQWIISNTLWYRIWNKEYWKSTLTHNHKSIFESIYHINLMYFVGDRVSYFLWWCARVEESSNPCTSTFHAVFGRFIQCMQTIHESHSEFKSKLQIKRNWRNRC